jgi:hypothetical protein
MSKPRQRPWSPWMPFILPNVAKTPNVVGLYQARGIDMNGTPIVIPRALRRHLEGTLDYGMSGDLRRRRTELWRTVQPGATRSAHSGGAWYQNFGFTQLVPYNCIEFRFQTTCNRRKAAELEWYFIAKYKSRFFDAPPWNINSGHAPRESKYISYMQSLTGRTPLTE